MISRDLDRVALTRASPARQIELAGLLTERMQLQEGRAAESVHRWAFLLRVLKGQPAHKVAEALAAAAQAEDAGAEAAREELHGNMRQMVEVHDALSGGMPSEEREELVGLHWENALLRAEMHACRQSLEQVRLQVEQLAVVSQAKGWRHEGTAPLLTELSVTLASLSSEHEAALDLLHAPDRISPDRAVAAEGRLGRKPHFLAQLVPAMLQQNAERFGRMLEKARDTMGAHRAAREKLCGELHLIRSGPDADDFVSTVDAATAAAAGGADTGRKGGPGALVRRMSKGFKKATGGSKPASARPAEVKI